MSSQESYDALLNTIMEIPDNEIKHPNMSVKEVIAEAEKLAVLSTEDKAVLVHASIDEVLIDSLNDRIGAYSIAAANHVVCVDGVSDVEKAWENAEPLAITLQKELLRNFRFAYRKFPDQKEAVERIAKGKGIKDTLFDLLVYNQLGQQFPEPLQKIHFDMSLLDKGKELYDKLSDLLAKTVASPEKVDEAKVIKYKAYTYLNKSVSEIKEHAYFVFSENPERLEKYTSSYRSELRKGKTKTEDIQETEE